MDLENLSVKTNLIELIDYQRAAIRNFTKISKFCSDSILYSHAHMKYIISKKELFNFCSKNKDLSESCKTIKSEHKELGKYYVSKWNEKLKNNKNLKKISEKCKKTFFDSKLFKEAKSAESHNDFFRNNRHKLDHKLREILSSCNGDNKSQRYLVSFLSDMIIMHMDKAIFEIRKAQVDAR